MIRNVILVVNLIGFIVYLTLVLLLLFDKRNQKPPKGTYFFMLFPLSIMVINLLGVIYGW